MSSSRDLFGGAITALLPTSLIDASTLRQIPDTQEVLVSPISDISFIIEILQRVPPNDSKEAARFHFDSLAHDNEAEYSEVLSVDTPSDDLSSLSDVTPPPILLSGIQRISKFNQSQADEVHILLAVYRIISRNVDLVLSANIPMTTNNGGKLDATELTRLKEVFSAAAASLKIMDFGLFA